jgi:hypothetical protein
VPFGFGDNLAEDVCSCFCAFIALDLAALEEALLGVSCCEEPLDRELDLQD